MATETMVGGASQQTVVGIAANYKEALRAVDELRRSGFADGELSVVARHEDPPKDSLHDTPAGTPEPHDEASIARGAAKGGVAGGVGGLLLGAGALLIPGVGPVLASGLFLGALGGATAGAVTGGLTGVLTEQGLPETRAKDYETRLHKGEVIVSAHSSNPDLVEAAREILERYEELADRPL